MTVCLYIWFHYDFVYSCFNLGQDEINLCVAVCQGVEGGWLYEHEDQKMVYNANYQDEEGNNQEMKFCVEMRGLGGALILSQCDKDEKKQKWIWEEYKPYWA